MFWFGKKKKQAAEAAKKAEAEKKAAEAAKKAEAEKQAAEAAKKAEAEKKAAEAAKKAEAEKKAAEAAKKAEAEKKAAEAAKKAEAEKKAAEAAKKAEAEKKAEADKANPAKEEESAKQQELSSKENSAEEAEEISEETAKSRGKFEIKKTSDGRFMFNLRAANTQIIASSQIYASMAACKNGIASIGANASIANTEDQTLSTVNVEKCPKFQIYLDKGGKYRFNLIATNGQNILSCTQGYMQKSSCKNGIHSVIQNSDAPVVMAEETK